MIAATPFFSDRGCHIRIYNEIKYLEKNNVDVTLCTYHLGYNPPGINAQKIHRIINIPWYKKITPGASWHKIYLDFLLLILTWKMYLKIKPKVIHAHLYESLLIAWLIKLFSFSRVKIVFDCQGSLAEEMLAYTLHKSKFLKPLYFIFVFIEGLLLKMPTKIVCSSKNSFNFIKEKYHISDEEMTVLDDGIDTDLFKPHTIAEKEELKREWGIPKENIVILYTGSMTQAKGVKELLDAVPEILKENNRITFVFAGYGDLESVYKEKYKDLIESKNVLITGRFSYFDLSRYIAIADYAIDPKRGSSESSGKIYNYMAGGLRIVCFKNDFNQVVLGNDGLYISSFFELIKFDSVGYYLASRVNLFHWNDLIKRLARVYEVAV